LALLPALLLPCLLLGLLLRPLLGLLRLLRRRTGGKYQYREKGEERRH
jgi:hypothetical protein